MKVFTTLLVLISISTVAQIKGIVKDSLTNQPIPFVNIWVENENRATTSEENGTFVFPDSEKGKNLVFSAIGYKKKTISSALSKEVVLQPTDYQLDEVVISNRLQTKEVQIGKTENTVCQAFDNGPKIDTKFFPYDPSYKKTKFIKKVSVYTDCRIEEATVKIHFYSVNADGFPDKELLSKDLIVKIKKGTRIHTIDVTKFNLSMPKNGIFVGFEKLLIESNRFEKPLFDKNTNTPSISVTYYPYMLYNYVERDELFRFSGGKWNKQIINIDENLEYKKKIYEPSIQLLLTN